MAIENWTDVDYAQAAIDMLPGSVEEIEEFLRVNGIKRAGRRGDTCPIAVWVKRWTGGSCFAGRSFIYPTGLATTGSFPTPDHVREFISAYDHRLISL